MQTYKSLSRIFTKNTISNLLECCENNVYYNIANKYINCPTLSNNKEIISNIYYIMLKYYRNEYIYKNILFNKLVMGKYSLNTTSALTEVKIEKSKADFILINGKAVVYEIKTELDTLCKLNGQIKDYYKAFKDVYVITNEKNYIKVVNTLENNNIGICILTKRNTISIKKVSSTDDSKLDTNSMFKILRKREYENIILKHYSNLPSARQVEYYDECLKLFNSIEKNLAYEYLINELKLRNKIDIIEFKNKVPYELRFLVYFLNFKKNDYYILENFLNNKFRG